MCRSGGLFVENDYLCTRYKEKVKSKEIKINKEMAQEDVFKKIVSHCKEYGFVFPSSKSDQRVQTNISSLSSLKPPSDE
jgi:hypothetical protein